MAYNLASPNHLQAPINLDGLGIWFDEELAHIPSRALRGVVSQVAQEIDSFVQWPREAVLLWLGCDRIAAAGARQRYHSYPAHLRTLGRDRGVVLDSRPNGPAIAAFLIAGGIRPPRFGSTNAWSVHHVYDGKFPYPGQGATTHAAKRPEHFTQSAGLVAIHPVADALAGELPAFAWLLRAQSYLRFGYDPDSIFASQHGLHGFAAGGTCRVVTAGDCL